MKKILFVLFLIIISGCVNQDEISGKCILDCIELGFDYGHYELRTCNCYNFVKEKENKIRAAYTEYNYANLGDFARIHCIWESDYKYGWIEAITPSSKILKFESEKFYENLGLADIHAIVNLNEIGGWKFKCVADGESKYTNTVEVNSFSLNSQIPEEADIGDEIIVKFDFLKNGKPINSHISISDIKIDGKSCENKIVEKTINFKRAEKIEDMHIFEDDTFIFKSLPGAELNIVDGYAIMKSGVNDGLFIQKTEKLPDKYVVETDIKMINYELDLTNSPENGFYWNTINDRQQGSPGDDDFRHLRRKVSIDINNHNYNGMDVIHPVYLMYYYGNLTGYGATYYRFRFYDGNSSNWGKWLPSFYYENNVWYRTRIGKDSEKYTYKIFYRDNMSLIVEASINISDIYGQDEDWFYVGEPTDRDFIGVAAVDNIKVDTIEWDKWYDHGWNVKCKLPKDISLGKKDVLIEVQYVKEQIRIKDTFPGAILIK